MKIKKFKARTFSEALELVKKELSEDAVILSSEEKKGLRPYVEVTAGVDYDVAGLKGEENSSITSNSGQRPYFQQSETTMDDIKKEIERLKESLEEMKFYGFEITLPERKKRVFHILRSRGIKEEFALRLCEKVKALEDIIDALKADISGISRGMWSGWRGNRAIMLIGPTGVGKTTTVAKLSAIALRERKRVALINLDTYRIGAPEQIRTYARILGIPLHMASNSRELKEGLKRFSKEREVVFIDTTGRNPRDEGNINEITRICSEIKEDKEVSNRLPLEIHLLMNTNCDSNYMIESYRHYSRLPISHIAFTKVDEAVRFGNIYNMLMIYQKPIVYLTTGQKVPDDIEFPVVEEIAWMILR